MKVNSKYIYGKKTQYEIISISYSNNTYKSLTLLVMVNALSLITTIFPFDKSLKKKIIKSQKVIFY